MTRKSLAASVLALTMISSASAATPPKPLGAAKKIRSIEGITEYALDNGMQVLLFPDSSKDAVIVDVVYRVGSRNEGSGETGMAHLLEHMLFKGAKNFPTLTQELQKRGAAFNADTWYDRTQYFETLAATEDN